MRTFSSDSCDTAHRDDSKFEKRLKQEYLDTAADLMTREHAFYAYWNSRITTHRILTRLDLEEMLEFAKHHNWLAPLGDCLRTAATMDILVAADVEWLMQELPSDSFAWQQISALHLLNDEAVAIDLKLTRLLEFRADWAIRRLIDSAQVQALNNWVAIIKASRRPNAAKHALLEYLLQMVTDHNV